MSEKPIIFSGPMVRAILGGRKTQTRRLVTAGTSHCSLPLDRLDFSADAKWGGPFVDGRETQYLLLKEAWLHGARAAHAKARAAVDEFMSRTLDPMTPPAEVKR